VVQSIAILAKYLINPVFPGVKTIQMGGGIRSTMQDFATDTGLPEGRRRTRHWASESAPKRMAEVGGSNSIKIR